jgi:histidinol-phosphatase (PHP family)
MATPSLPDYHTHTRLCKHADGVPLDYVRAAEANGIPEIACTDHCPTDDKFGIGHRMALTDYDTYEGWVREAQAAAGNVRVLYGVEADYYPNCERFLKPWLDSHEYDVVLGSVHFLDYWAEDATKKGLSNAKHPAKVWKGYFELIGRMADSGMYDIATHLDLPKKFGNPINDRELRDYCLPALDRIAEAGMCMEINTSGLNHPPKEAYPSLQILAWARERGIGLTFGSDAHQPARVGADFESALQLARNAGYTAHVRFEKRKQTVVPLM